MATYAEITSTKTINLDADGGTKTLTYYAGNKNQTTGSVVGNVDKKTITYLFDTTTSWISTVSFSNRDDTAKNITITYSKNTGTSERSVNFKLKDQTSLYYLILKQAGNTQPTYNGTNLWLNLFTLIDYADVYQNLDINKQAIDKIYIYPGDQSYGCAYQKVLDSNEIDMFTFDLNKQKNTLNTAYSSNWENNNNHFSNNIINGTALANVHINHEIDADMKGKYIVFSDTYTGTVYMNQLRYEYNNTLSVYYFKNMVSQDLTNGGFKLRISFNSTLANSSFGKNNKTLRCYASLDANDAYNLGNVQDTYNIFASISSQFTTSTYNPRAYKDFSITGSVGNQVCEIYVPIDFESYDILTSLSNLIQVFLFLCVNTDIASINHYGIDGLSSIPF